MANQQTRVTPGSGERMTEIAPVTSNRIVPKEEVLPRLEEISRTKGREDLLQRLQEIRLWIKDDLLAIENVLLSLHPKEPLLQKGTQHLLQTEGKRLRPICVLLASRFGKGSRQSIRDLAIAAELVHNATLLHDDVIDMGEKRRGVPTTRVLYGNSVSIYAGDWLLVEALQRITRAGIPELVTRGLLVLKEMLEAETKQLANRGALDITEDQYFQVVKGKTASLFRWALYAGGRAGGCPTSWCEALEQYGEHLGVAFQVVDDILDITGDPNVLGKQMFSDLREGKLTYPLLLATSYKPSLATSIADAIKEEGMLSDPKLIAETISTIQHSDAKEKSLVLVKKLTEEAISCLTVLPKGPTREALESVAIALLHRTK